MSTKKRTSTQFSDKAIRRLLKSHNCQVAFHEVRTRFLGNIASPNFAASPLLILKGLWGGELPEFEDESSAQKLLDVLISGLWNRLTRHQNRKYPFNLTRLSKPDDAPSISHYVAVRVAELDGFVTGLYGEEDVLYLPERAHEALENLGSIHSFLSGFSQFPNEGDSAKTGANLVELTHAAEQEINALILSCTESRRESLDQESVPKPTLH